MSNIIPLSDAENGAQFFPGMQVWWSGRLAAGAKQELCWVKFEPGAEYPMHSHPYEQISVVVQGRMRLIVGDETREIGPGDMWFVPADMPHGGQVLSEEPVIFIDAYAPPSKGDDSDVTYY
ncbi:MAG: cupin domain-containing protein [Pseudomonadota bacterium]